MPILIVEHSGKRKRAALNGRTLIGRTPNNDVVIEHPAVSRTHAIIESENGVYYIADAGSKNGTIVEDQTISGKFQLCDDVRIEIGPAVLTFHVNDDTAEPSGPSTLTETHAGMLMDCECGAKLWVPREMIGARGQCQKCGRTLLLGSTQSAPSQVCSICQWKIEPTDNTHTCPACKLIVHEECWQENRGCSAYGCSQVNILEKPDEVVAQMEEIGHPPTVLAQPHRFPWEFAALAASVIGSIVGLPLFGAVPLITMLGAGVYLLKHGAKTRVPVLLVAMLLSLVGLIAGLLFSCIFWLNMRLR